MTKGFRHGISATTREHEITSDRQPVNPQQPAMGFYVGTVMDDQDDQRMGRIWVYIPEFSNKRFDENSVPMYGGTVPDRQSGRLEFDIALRSGWILCYPLLPFAGSDDFRVGQGPDGRVSREGDVNSYGMWQQPRNGDYVAVMFEKGDPASGYYIGMMPKYYRNYMMPGHAAKSKTEVNSDTDSAAYDESVAGALLPVMDRARDSADGGEDIPAYPSTTFADNLLVAGVLYDPMRGAGTSSARRESPSYVTGWKSAGWVFDSEKWNHNTDGTTLFEDEQEKYAKVNTAGHQFVMDDHPDFQGVRLRTSYGSEILFNDSGISPYIYVMTAKGNVWMELVDDGNIHVYGRGSFNLHAEQDINLTADRDINIEAFRNLNILVHNDERRTVKNETHWAFEKDQRILNMTNLDHTIQKDHTTLVERNVDRTVGKNVRETIQSNQDIVVGGTRTLDVGGSQYNMTGGIYSEEAELIFMNSGITSTAQEADEAEETNFPKLVKKPGPPTDEEVKKNKRPADIEYLGTIVPQHQPWPLRCGADNTFGTNGSVSTKQTRTPTVEDTRCVQSKAGDNSRLGAPMASQSAPTPIVGRYLNDPANNIYYGDQYLTQNRGEQPNYKLGRALRQGEDAFVGDLRPSSKLTDFIKSQETFQSVPITDIKGNPVIGYGHEMKVGEVIGGVTVTQTILDQIKSLNKVPLSQINITQQEATDLLTNELNTLAGSVANLFPSDFLMTQGTFDGLLSLGRNVGASQLKNTPEGQNIIQGIQTGDNAKVQSNWMKYVHTDGVVNCDLVNRRQQELNDHVGEDIDKDGVAQQQYQPTNPVGCGNTNIDEGVMDAIGQASANNGVPYEYLMAMAAQESGFNPNAQASTSSAKGLFQFIDSTWDSYGGGANVYDPYANADAAAKLAKDNKSTLENGALSGVRTATPTDLYMAHFLGGGGANQFLANQQANPNGSAAAAFPAAAAANPSIFYNKDGTPKTYDQVYGYFDKKINNNIANYGGCKLPN